MRVGFVRNVGLAAVGLAVAALAACNDDPLGFDNDTTFDIFANPTVMTVPAGVVTKLATRAINEGGEPTFEHVAATVSPACVTVVDDTTRVEIQPPGLFVVTGGTTVGTCTITLTAGSITKEVRVLNVAAGILILDAPPAIVLNETVQLSGQLVSADDPPAVVGPFVPTDATWTTSDTLVATVDETGLVTGIGQGTATIEACWSGTDDTGTSGTGYEICDEVAIEILVPAPTIDSFLPVTGLVGEMVTIDLTGLLEPHIVLVDAVELNPMFIESRTENQIVIRWPFNGIGDHEVTVGTLAEATDPVIFSLTSEGSADDPAYLDPGTAPLTALPMKKVAYLQPTALDHFYLINLAAPATLIIDADWDSGMDLDILVVDEAFTAFECTDGATGAQPEQSVCSLGAGGHLIWINNYDAAMGNYVLTAVFE